MMLAFAGALAVEQGSLDADDRIEAGEDVGEGHADLHGFRARHAIGLAGDRHDAGHALDHEVVARPLRIAVRSGRSR